MSLTSLFSPRSIAVIGASNQPDSVGNDLTKNLVESKYSGKIYLINPHRDTLFDRPCYPSLSALPEIVELILIAVPAHVVPSVLREAGMHGVPSAVILSAGFKETGVAGARLESELRDIAKSYQMNILGPNCLGFIQPKISLNASFASSEPQSGSVGFFSQSGALTSAFLDLLHSELGFSLFASIGNKVTLSETDFLSYFIDDPDTKTIGFYTESLTQAKLFIDQGRHALVQKKPLIVLKSGRTQAGTHASTSHTGAVAGSDQAYDALFRQAKMIRADSFEELLDFLKGCNHNPLSKGNRLAIVTNAGGLGVLATDAAVKHGLTVAPLETRTKENLRSFLPSAASVENPIDILGDALPDRYEATLKEVAADPTVDMLLIILTPQTMTDTGGTAAVLSRLRSSHPDLPLAAVFSGDRLIAPGLEELRSAKIPHFLYPESGATALAALSYFSSMTRQMTQSESLITSTHKQKEARRIFDAYLDQGLTQIGEYPASQFLSASEFPFLRSALVTTPEAATQFAETLGIPVALKIASPHIIHKSDVDGVMLNVAPESVASAFLKLIATVQSHVPEATIEGVTISEMAKPGGRELLLGLKKEPGLGSLVVLGLGGIYVETFKDIVMRFAPLYPSDIDEMLNELHALPLLQGTRGQSGIDISFLKSLIARLSVLATDFPEIEELDMNPLLAFPEGNDFRVLDARMRITPSQKKKPGTL